MVMMFMDMPSFQAVWLNKLTLVRTLIHSGLTDSKATAVPPSAWGSCCDAGDCRYPRRVRTTGSDVRARVDVSRLVEIGSFSAAVRKNMSLVQSISQGPGEQDARAHK
jgi:hypothetical protein